MLLDLRILESKFLPSDQCRCEATVWFSIIRLSDGHKRLVLLDLSYTTADAADAGQPAQDQQQKLKVLAIDPDLKEHELQGEVGQIRLFRTFGAF